MTVSTTTSRVSYSGNGSTVTFTVPFYFIYSTDLKVYKTSSANVQTLLVEGTDYTVTGAGVISGGSITCTTAPSSDYTIIIYRDPDTTQLVDYQANDPFPAETHERALDKLTMIAQRLNDVNDRSFHMSDGDTSGATLEIASPEANYLIGWNSTGDALQNVDPATLATVVSYATAYADTFTGDGTTTSWTLSRNPAVLYNLDVSINGVTQVPVTDYTLSGTTFTTTTAAPLNAVILVKYKEGLPNYSGDSQDVRYVPAGTGAVATTVQSKLRQTVSVKDFGAVGDGSANDTTAVQNATNTGKAVFFPAGTYKVSGVTYTGQVVWFSNGDATILSDSTVLTVTSGTNSIIDNLTLQNITAPWIIYRNPATWATPTPVQSNGNGYQPTVNDTDIWSGLTTAQQNQDIGPKIAFSGNASHIQVSRIKGRFVSVLIYDAQYSVVRDCDFIAGKNSLGGIVFWNVGNQQGTYNSAINNKISYASFNGIVFGGNYDGLIQGNQIYSVGESGIKTYQNTTGIYDNRCYRMTVSNNQVLWSYYDGFDITNDYPQTGTIDSRNLVIGNDSYGNHGVGFYLEGKYNLITGNKSRSNYYDAYRGWLNYNSFTNNFAYGNNTSSNAGRNQITIDGNNNLISSNKIDQTVGVGYALYATGTNVIDSNYATGGTSFFGNPGLINSVVENTIDASTGLLTTQAFSFGFYNNGSVLQHYTYTDPISATLGNNTSRIIGSTSAYTTTPTGTDNTTAFAGGAKIGSASTNTLYFNTAAQTAANFQGVASVVLNTTGTAVTVVVGTSSININGVTRNRVCMQFYNASTGAAFALNTTNIPSGKTLQMQLLGKIA